MRGTERAVLRALLLCGGLLFSAVAQAQCTKDTDCKGDRVCDAGKCTYPATALPPPPPTTPPGAPEGAPPPVAPPPGTVAPPPGTVAPLPVAAPPPAPVMTVAPAAATEPLPQADEPATVRRSKPALVAGIIMVSIAPVALLGALGAKSSQEKCDQQLASEYPNHVLPTSERYRADDCDDYSAPYYALLITGAVMVVGGVPLIIYGAKSLPAPTRTGNVHVLPWATQTSGGLRLRVDL
ncbi:MAG TPA: hypothetical protein VHB79_11630 [Polyangiaceae bacterium]|nr:hypothetical protein [Polyangiaceae bacterium]